jgi:beta-phosphoglucomutase-like phosphatase (HAD superfamily)
MADFRFPIGPFQAFLFDMDGTLLTSRAAIERVWKAWSLRWGLDATEVSGFLHGRRATDAIDRNQRTIELDMRGGPQAPFGKQRTPES